MPLVRAYLLRYDEAPYFAELPPGDHGIASLADVKSLGVRRTALAVARWLLKLLNMSRLPIVERPNSKTKKTAPVPGVKGKYSFVTLGCAKNLVDSE
ncbi:MAG TPA: hypothetical protein VGE52_02410, partial [Pirellulales bacterium]